MVTVIDPLYFWDVNGGEVEISYFWDGRPYFLICRIEPDSGADIDEIANIHFLESISNMLRLSREVAF